MTGPAPHVALVLEEEDSGVTPGRGFEQSISERPEPFFGAREPGGVGEAVNTTTAIETRSSLAWDGTQLLFGRAPGPEGSTGIYISSRDRATGADESPILPVTGRTTMGPAGRESVRPRQGPAAQAGAVMRLLGSEPPTRPSSHRVSLRTSELSVQRRPRRSSKGTHKTNRGTPNGLEPLEP